MEWLEKLITLISFRSDYRTSSSGESTNGDETNETFPRVRNQSVDYSASLYRMDGIATPIKLAIERLGVVSDVNRIYELLANSIGSEGVIDLMILRKQGELLCTDILRAHNIRANTKIGSLFWDCLNEQGRSDPVGVACTVSRIANSLAYSVNTIARISDAMGDDCQVQKIENNMLAGPCDAVKALPEIQQAGQAHPFPLLDCTHPDQCACLYQATMDLD